MRSYYFRFYVLLFILKGHLTHLAYANDQMLQKLADEGKNLFLTKGCSGCHSIGKGPLSGPDLQGLYERRNPQWVINWIHDPGKILQSDPYAQELLKKWSVRMPNLPLTESEIKALMAYISINGGGELKSDDLLKLTVETSDAESSNVNTDQSEEVAKVDDKTQKPQGVKAWLSSLFSRGSKSGIQTIEEIAKARGLTPDDILAAVKTYTPTGKKDPFLMFASGGHGGGVLVIGIPSMRIIKTIPVFTPDSWHGYGVGSEHSTRMLKESSRDDKMLTWGDVHHPALSETNGMYDGQFLFVNDKANARIAVIDLKDFETKQIVANPLYINDHGGAFVTPNTEYIIETSQYNVPLPNRYESLSEHAQKYRGVATFWKFNREKGRIDPQESFSIELPPYWHDLTDAGKQISAGYVFLNTLNTEQAVGGNMEGAPNIEIGASKNDMDFLHVINWSKAENLIKQGKFITLKDTKLINLKTAIDEGIVHLIHEPKSPHGVDVSPNGNYIVVSGKLDPHTTVYSFEKIKKAIDEKNYESKDQYGIPILNFDAVKIAQIEVGLGPLHTQFDRDGYAYTSLFLDSAIAKWSLGEPYFTNEAAWKMLDKVQVHYNIGHLSCIEGDTVSPGKGYCVALNKWSIDRYNDVGPLLPQNFQLVDTSLEKMKVIYDLPIPNAEPHYVQIIDASRLKPIQTYPMGTDSHTMQQSPFSTAGGQEKIVRNGKKVEVYMTLIRSHITPDHIEVNKGDHVTIYLSSIEAARDATHGFAISAYNINLSIEPGEVEKIEFIADKPGVFPFYCTEFCSALHLEMTGYLLVKDSK